jgi:hypothetical protein
VAELQFDPRLAAVNAAFVRALDGYLTACRTFRLAALAKLATTRISLLDRGVDQAVAADRLYDRAAGQLQQIRRDLKLPPNSSFPQPTGGHHS